MEGMRRLRELIFPSLMQHRFAADRLYNQLFNLKFSAKQFARQSKKSEKKERAERLKIKQAIERQNVDGAKIYAQNAIRERTHQLNYMRLASRIEGVAARLDAAIRMRSVTSTMASIVATMDRALQSMDMSRIASVMDQFERQFEDLDVQSTYVEGAMAQSDASSVPGAQVDELISQVADEYHLSLGAALATTPSRSPAAASTTDDLTARLEKMRAV
jgi:charged multivesicular body protein 1